MLLLELLGHRAPDRTGHRLSKPRAPTAGRCWSTSACRAWTGTKLPAACASETLQHVILVALTGYSREEDRQRALASGFDYHLVKPVDVDKFQGLVTPLVAPPKQTTVH